MENGKNVAGSRSDGILQCKQAGLFGYRCSLNSDSCSDLAALHVVGLVHVTMSHKRKLDSPALHVREIQGTCPAVMANTGSFIA